MKRARVPQTLLAALLMSAAAGAAPAMVSGAGAAPVAQRGAYTVTFAINTGSSLPPGATLLCKAHAVPNAPQLENLQLPASPVASNQSLLNQTAPTGSWANCTVEVPFYWVAGTAQGGALLSYEVALVDAQGAVILGRQDGIALALPAPGTTASLSVNVHF